MMFDMKRSYHEWAAMVPWQRNDLLERFAKRQEKLQKELDDQRAQMEASMNMAKFNVPTPDWNM